MKRLLVSLLFAGLLIGFFMASDSLASTMTLQFDPNHAFSHATADGPLLGQQGIARKVDTGSGGSIFRTYDGYREPGHTAAGDLAAVHNILGWIGADAGYMGISYFQLYLNGGLASWGENVVMKPNTTLSSSVNGEDGWTAAVASSGSGFSVATYNTVLGGVPAEQNALSSHNWAQNLWSVTGDFFVDNNSNGINDAGDTNLVDGQNYTMWFAAVINNWPYKNGVDPNLWGSPYEIQGTIIGRAMSVPEPGTMLLLGCGLLGIGIIPRKKANKANI